MGSILFVNLTSRNRVLSFTPMFKRIGFVIIILIVLTSLNYAAQDKKSSEPEQESGVVGEYNSYINLTLSGAPIIKNNNVDVMKTKGGLSFFGKNDYFLRDLNITTSKEIDPVSNTIILMPKIAGKFELYHPIELSYDNYLNNTFAAQFNAQLNDKMQVLLKDEKRESETGLIPDIVIDLPPLPRSLRRFIGDRPSRLSLTGSQKLTISGSSTKRDDRRLTERGDGSSFSLDMRQDLNLLLRGTIGEKIFVNVKHNSSADASFADPSNVEIEYKGDEDEIVQSIKGGNISLALSGSQFISYSASSKGLFGVRGDFKLGDLKLTAIASKEESAKLTKKFTGTDAADSLQYRSKDFVERTHYYIHNPKDLFDLYEDGDSNLPGYAHNAIRTTNTGAWVIAKPELLPDKDQPFRVYLDIGQIDYSENTINGWEIGENPNEIDPYNFLILEINTDFSIDFDTGTLTLHRAIERRHSIGVTYTQRDGIQIGNPDEMNLRVKMIRRANQSPHDTETWPLQVRNMYNLNKKNIQNDGFRVNFFTYNPDGSLNYYADDNVIPGGIEINEYLRLDTNGDGVINGYDETINLNSGYIILPFIEPFQAFSDHVIYEHETFSSSDLEQINVYLSIVGKVGRDKIELGQMNLLPGSVRVIVDGETLQENIHYLVDYDFGHVTFLTDKGKNPDSDIEINYEYVPLFAVESKTLMGFRADWAFSDLAQVGGTFIYQSEKVSDRRPKIGNENKSLLMANVDSKLEFEPSILTKMVDLIPLIRTDTPSKVRLSGEVAMTLPSVSGHKDQADRKEAYLDDMESIVDSYPLGLTRAGWSPSSKPLDIGFIKARPNWYNPDNIYAEQVYSPEFLTLKERREKVQVLTLRTIPPDITNPNIKNQYWGGVMRYLGNEIDFSEKKYIEVLVKVDQYPYQPFTPSATMHIELGDISEDFYVWNGGKGVLNTEDGANGGMRDGILEPREDVGLDGIPSGDMGDDPLDKFNNEKDQYGDYPYINGTSGNGVLDTEDLNANGILDTLNRYFQYTIDLNGLDYESEHNGWQLYRIPVDEFLIKTESSSKPDLRRINYARIWLETEETTRVHIAKLHLIGTKWQDGNVKTLDDRVLTPVELENYNESISTGVVDNQNNRDHYVSPPGTTVIENGIPLFEQSLTLDFKNLQNNHIGQTIQRFRDSQNFLSYGKLRYWVYLEKEKGDELPAAEEEQDIVFRVGADSLNYYEVRYPTTPLPYASDGFKMDRKGWKEVEIDFSQLTSLKQYVESSTESYAEAVEISVNGLPETAILRVVGNKVTLTNIREMSIGVINNGIAPFNGRLYANEIRVADPYEDIGFAARTSLNTTFADFSTLDASLVWKSENFNTSTARSKTSGSGNEESVTFNLTNKYNLHKFLPAAWGFSIPLTLMRNQSYGTPRYKANSDILRVDIQDPNELERERRESLVQSAEVTVGQSVTPRSKLLQYTVKSTTLRGNIKQTNNRTATSADTTLVYSGNMNYNLNLPKDKLGVKLTEKYQLFFFPQSINNTVDYRAELPNRWRWDTNLADTVAVKWTPERYIKESKNLSLSSTVNYDLTTDIKTSYGFSQKRDLTIDKILWDFLPWGRESSRDQNITLNYSPNYLQKIFTYSIQGSIRYSEQQKPIQTTGIDDPEDYEYHFEGDVNRTARVNFTLKNKDLLTGLMNKYGIRYKELSVVKPDDFPEDFTPLTDPFDGDSGFQSDFEPLDSKFPDLNQQQTPDQARIERERLDRERLEAERMRELREAEKGERPDSPERPPRPDAKIQEQRLWAKALSLIARTDNLNLTYENTYGSRYSKKDERPNFLYQLGIPHQFENEKEELDMLNTRDSYSASTAYPILANLSTSISYAYTVDRRYSTASQKEVTTVFPNIRATLTGFERIIRADKILSSSRLSSSYTYTEKERGSIDWDKPDYDKASFLQQTYAFSPLISWSANWVFDVSTSLSYNLSKSVSTNFRDTFDAIQKSDTNSINSNISYSFRSPQGIKLPFLGTRMPVTNEMTTELGINWEKAISSNKGVQETIVDKDTEKYSIIPKLTYNFSKNIKGGLQSNYDNTHDKKRDERIRTFSLSIWAEIIF